jgi:hypothetical protein
MCDICKKKPSIKEVSKIHFTEYVPITLRLCFEHDLELFKGGQVGFILKYKKELETCMQKTRLVDKSNSNFGF